VDWRRKGKEVGNIRNEDRTWMRRERLVKIREQGIQDYSYSRGRRFAIFEHFSGRFGMGKKAQNSTHESYGITRKAFRGWDMYRCELDYGVDVRDQ
jgi:hypothetical protein